MCYIGTDWLYTKKLSASPPFSIPGKERAAQAQLRAVMALGQQRRCLALNKGTNCSTRRARNQQWHMGGGPWAARQGQPGLPTTWTGKVCELLPCLAQSIIQQMEHISHTAGERRAGVGVGEHLTQAPFVLWARLRITVRGSCGLQLGTWAGYCEAIQGEENTAGTITTLALWYSHVFSIFVHFVFKMKTDLIRSVALTTTTSTDTYITIRPSRKRLCKLMCCFLWL